jgi:hypothetical protein
MGGKSKEEIRQIIQNRVSQTIQNINETIANISSTTINEISTSVINQQKAKSQSDTTGLNEFILQNTTIGSGAILDNNQRSEVTAITQAVINLKNDNQTMMTMLNDISNEISSKIKNDTSLQADLEAVNGLLNKKDVEGELNNAINTIGSSLDNAITMLSGGTKTKEQEQSLINEIEVAVSNINKNEANINNYIKNVTNTNFTNTSDFTCTYLNAATNKALIQGVILEPGAMVRNDQVSAVSALNSCIISSVISNTDIKDIINRDKAKQEADYANTSTIETKEKVKNTIENISKTSSIVTSLLSSFMALMIIGLILLVVVVIIIILTFKKTIAKTVSVATMGLVK